MPQSAARRRSRSGARLGLSACKWGWVALSMGLSAGCASSSRSATTAGNAAPPQPLMAAGPGLERLPAPAPEADSADAIVVLEEPRSRGSAERLVHSFFDAVRRESLRDLSALVVDGASMSSGPGTSPEPIVRVWAARFKRLEYAATDPRALYREDEVGVFTADELQRLRGARRYELVPGAGEILAVVTPRDRVEPAGGRSFGRRLEFILGSTPAGLRILRMFEDFRLP
jgi:hypothetical protein